MNLPSIPRIALTGLFAACSLAGNPLPAQEPLPAFRAPLAERALVLDVQRVGDRLIAVGERGHILISDDGQTWRQASEVPVRATLTRVTARDGRMWAVGHDSTILHSDDHGEHWRLQHFDPEAEQPLLDVVFFDAEEGIAIGAYGLFMTTVDGGRHWATDTMAERLVGEIIDWEAVFGIRDGEGPQGTAFSADGDDDGYSDEDYDWAGDDFDDGDLEDEFYDAEADFDKGCYEFMECHLNKLLALDERRLMIAAERGYGFRSSDRGETWEAFRFPYTGSMFGLIGQGECVLAFGLRGHVQRSCDFAETWEVLDTGTEQTLMGATLGPEGEIVMVGAAATRLILRPGGSLELSSERLGSDYAAVAIGPDGALILGGEDGVRHD